MDLRELAEAIGEWRMEKDGDRHAIFVGVDLIRGEHAAVISGEATNIIAMIISTMLKDQQLREILEAAVNVAHSEGFNKYLNQNKSLN